MIWGVQTLLSISSQKLSLFKRLEKVNDSQRWLETPGDDSSPVHINFKIFISTESTNEEL